MYGIMRIEKRKRQAVSGLKSEANRTERPLDLERFSGSDIDWDRTRENIRLVSSENWWRDIKKEIDKTGVKTVRKDAVVMLDAVYTASPEFFQGKSKEETLRFFNSCLSFHKSEFGHVVNAVIHFDETTPHLHICSVPITQDGRLSAKNVMGNKSDYHNHQDRFFAFVAQDYGLERGQVKDHIRQRKHIDQMLYKEQQAEPETKRKLVRAEQQVKQLQHTVNGFSSFLVRYGLVKAWTAFRSAVQDKGQER